jgi:hypothetical protein
MTHFILRYRGTGAKPEKDVRRIECLPHLRILDDSSPRMLLVEAPADEMQALADSLTDWVISAERNYKLPDPRPRPRAQKSQDKD